MRLKELGLTAASVLVFFLALEGVLRIVGYVPSYGDPSAYKALGNDGTYVLTPGWNGLYAGVAVQINSLGFRSAELNLVDGRKRVLLLGDSLLFGQGVDEPQAMSALLGTNLRTALGTDVEVINTGVAGYNTDLEARTLARLWPLRPDVVVLLYVVDNDSDPKPGILVDSATGRIVHPAARAGVFGRVSLLLHRHSRTYNFLRLLLRSLTFTATPPKDPAGRDAFADSAPGWGLSRRTLERMNEECRGHGVPFLVAGVGLVQRVQGLDALRAFCESRGIAYHEIWRTTDLEDYMATYAVSQFDGHPNATGHRILADRLAPALVESLR